MARVAQVNCIWKFDNQGFYWKNSQVERVAQVIGIWKFNNQGFLLKKQLNGKSRTGELHLKTQ